MSESAFRQRWQAGWRHGPGSAFDALVCSLLAQRLPQETARCLPPPSHMRTRCGPRWNRFWPQPGLATTVFHSIALQYCSQKSQQRIASRRLSRAGAGASKDTPLAWARLKHDLPGAGEATTLRLTLWRGHGAEDRLLGRAHPHGRMVAWQ
jgi:hypothetical protein